MGNETSNIRIRLNERDGESEDIGKHKLTRSKSDYESIYYELTYKIEYKNDKFKFDLYIALDHDHDPFFLYYNFSKSHRVTEVNCYYRKENDSRPLLFKFKTSHGTFTYRYYDLLAVKSTLTILIDGIDCIGESEFKKELEEEAEVIKKEKELSGKTHISDYASIYLGMNPIVPTKYIVNVSWDVKCEIIAYWAKCDFCKNVRILKFKVRYYGDKLYSVWDNAWYKWSDKKYYVNIYTGTDYNHPGTNIFTYYPRSNRYTIVFVEAFFALMDTTKPFCIGFHVRKGGEFIYTRYDELVAKGSAYNYNFVSMADRDIEQRVKDSFSQTFKKFSFRIANLLSTYVDAIPPDDLPEHRLIIRNNRYKKVMFRGDNTTYGVRDRQMFDCRMFTINFSDDACKITGSRDEPPKKQIQNKRIDKETIKGEDNTNIYGIVVYYTSDEIRVDKAFPKVLEGLEDEVEFLDKFPVQEDLAILVDFITDCNTSTQYVRKKVEGTEWKKEQVNYGIDSDLVKELNRIVKEMTPSKERQEFAKELEELKEKESGKKRKKIKKEKENEYDDDEYEYEYEDEDDDDDEEEEEEDIIEENGGLQTETTIEQSPQGPTVVTHESPRPPPGQSRDSQPKGHQTPLKDHKTPEERRTQDGTFGVHITGRVTEQGTGSTRTVTTSTSSIQLTTNRREEGKPSATKTEATKPPAAKPAPARPAAGSKSQVSSQTTASSSPRGSTSTSRGNTSTRGISGPQGQKGQRETKSESTSSKDKTSKKRKKKEKKPKQTVTPVQPPPPPPPPPPPLPSPSFEAQIQDSEPVSTGPSTATIAGASVGSIVTTAGVTAGATLATHPEWVIPVIKALT